MKQTFPTIENHTVELTKYAGCWAVDIYGYSEHATKTEAIAAAKKRIAANTDKAPFPKLPFRDRLKNF
jgi:hypothetical protein